MLDMIEGICSSKWFNAPSKLRCSVRPGNPRFAIMTGDNATGKSLARKILHNRYHDQKITFINTSQEGRATPGIQRAFMYGDQAENSTGQNSAHTLIKALKTAANRPENEPCALCIDEPETGCSDDTQASIGAYLADQIPNLGDACKGVFIITHSKVIVDTLLPLNPTHWHFGDTYQSLHDWRNAQPIARRSLEEIVKIGFENHWQIEELIKEGRKK